MRKLFTALLILSVMGGAFAQDEGGLKGTWGALSGEAVLGTIFTLHDTEIGLDADNFSAEFKLQYDYEKGDWSVSLPFTINDRGVTTMNWNEDDEEWDGGNAFVKWNPQGGLLTVTFPFGFHIKDTFNLLFDSFLTTPDGYDNAHGGAIGILAELEDDHYGFAFGMEDIFLTSRAVSTMYGWYKFFDDRALLAVNYSGYDTEWWRASDIVLSGQVEFAYDDGDGDNTIGSENRFSNWENINAEYIIDATTVPGRYSGGIGFKYNILPQLNVGVVFQGTALFDEDGGDFVKDFLLQPLVGVGFNDEDLGLAASAMFRLFTNPADKDKIGFNVAAGASFTGIEYITLAADVSAFEIGIADNANLSFGVEAGVEEMPLGPGALTAGLKFAMTDILDNVSSNAFGLEATAGYTLALNDALSVGAKAGLSLVMPKDGEAMIRSEINPFLTWNLIPNGAIDLGYTIGFRFNDKDPTYGSGDLVYKNEVALKFTWSF